MTAWFGALAVLALALAAGIVGQASAAMGRVHPLPLRWRHASSGWGPRVIRGAQDFHEGIDYPAPSGTPVRAPDAAVVERTHPSPRGISGVFVRLKHADGVVTIYAHLSEILVSDGEAVSRGQVIARTGNTGRVSGKNGGYHLHFGAQDGARYIDPAAWLRGGGLVG